MINLPLCIINQQMFQHILTQQQPNHILEWKRQREKKKSLPAQNRQFCSFQQCCLFLSRNTKFQLNLPSSLEPTPPCFHLDLWPVKWGIKAEESFQGPLVQPSHMQMPRVIPFLNPPLAPSSHELYCLHPSARRLVQNLKALIEIVFQSSIRVYLQPFLLQVILVPKLSFSLHSFSPPHFIPLTFVDGTTRSPLSLRFARLNKLNKFFISSHKTTHFPDQFELSLSVLLSIDVS